MNDSGEKDYEKYDRYRDSFARQNAEQQKVVTLVISFTTGLIVLPVLFFKDIFGETLVAGSSAASLVMAQSGFVQIVLVFGWIALAASLCFGLKFVYDSSDFLHGVFKYNYPPDFTDSEEGGAKARAIKSALIGQLACFALGTSLMMLFVATYVKSSVTAH